MCRTLTKKPVVVARDRHCSFSRISVTWRRAIGAQPGKPHSRWGQRKVVQPESTRPSTCPEILYQNKAQMFFASFVKLGLT